MITVKVNPHALRVFYCVEQGIGISNMFYKDVARAGGKIDTHGEWKMSAWTVEFDNEIDATAFKLKFGL